MAWVQGYVNWCNILWKNVGPQQAEIGETEESGIRYMCDMSAKDHARLHVVYMSTLAQTIMKH